jgi:hypothetical protein
MKLKIIVILIFVFNGTKGQVNKTPNQWYLDYSNIAEIGKSELKEEYKLYNFSPLLLKTPSEYIYGIIGDEMQRIQIKWISINKDPENQDKYYVYGKTKVNDNVCDFTGKISVKSVKLYPKEKWDLPEDSKAIPQKIGILFCEYVLFENVKNEHAGIFKGISATEFYISNNKLFYNDLNSMSDEMTNNQFVGEWISYTNKISKHCNWGDYRVPNVKNFDCGAGEFCPCDQYINKGWSDLYKAAVQNDLEAKKREAFEWWK